MKTPRRTRKALTSLVGIQVIENNNTRELSPITRISKQRKERENTRFNEVRQFAYVLGAKGERVFIESINVSNIGDNTLYI